MLKRRIQKAFIALSLFSFLLSGASAEKADEVRKNSFELISKGRTSYKRGEYEKAAEQLGKASHMALNSFLAHYYYGLSLFALRRYSEAVEPLKIALDLNPKHTQTHIALGDTYLKIGDHEEAYAEYYRIFEINKAYAPAYDGIGRYYESIGQQEEAIKNFEKAIDLNKGYAEAYLHLGDLYLRAGELGLAIELLSDAVEISPDFSEALNRLGVAYARMELYNRAVTTIKKAILLEPKEAIHYLALGEVFTELRNFQHAQSLFEKAIELDPELTDTPIALAKLQRLQNDYGQSLSTLEKTKSMKQVNAIVLKKIEDLQKTFLEEKLSLETRMKKIDEGIASKEDIENLSALYASKGDFLMASSLLEIMPGLEQSESAMKKLAYYLLKSDQFLEAKDILSKITSRWEEDAATLINAGACYSELGNHDQAIQHFLKALSLEPDNLSALLYLANSYLRVGNFAEAEKRYEHFIEKGGTGADGERVKKILSLLESGT